MQQRASQSSVAPTTPQPMPRPVQTALKSTANAASQGKVTAKAVAQGTKRFGEAIWGPMAHTGGVLWLEITGLFFALFAAFFGQNAYKFRGNWKGGPDRAHFIVYSALTILFVAFTVSQFYLARQKEKKNRARHATPVNSIPGSCSKSANKSAIVRDESVRKQ